MQMLSKRLFILASDLQPVPGPVSGLRKIVNHIELSSLVRYFVTDEIPTDPTPGKAFIC